MSTTDDASSDGDPGAPSGGRTTMPTSAAPGASFMAATPVDDRDAARSESAANMRAWPSDAPTRTRAPAGARATQTSSSGSPSPPLRSRIACVPD